MGALPGVNTVESTNFLVASSGETGGKSIKGGFKDPLGEYPTAPYLGKPDTNLLGQELVSEHASNSIKTTLQTGWTTATGTADQPASTQENAKYPYNHVMETESGHYIEFDDTKDNERIHIFHKKGTFIEIDASGNVVIKTVGNVTNVVAGNMDTYVAQNYNLSVGGTMGVYSKGLVTEKFDAGRKTTITGTETLDISGAVTNTFGDALTEEITGAVTQTLSATLTTNISGAASIKSTVAMVVGGSTISFN